MKKKPVSTSPRLPRSAHRQVIQHAQRLAVKNATAPTFWDGKPCKAQLCKVVIAQTMPNHPCYGLAGTVRQAVRVIADGETFFLDNPNGAGWLFLTEGRGNLNAIPYRVLPVYEVLENPETIELTDGRSQPEEVEIESS